MPLLAVSLLFAIAQIASVHDCACVICDGRPPVPLSQPEDGGC